MKQNLFFGKKTEKENIHLTLKFLREIDEEQIKKVQEKLKEIKVNSFEASIDEAGIFTSRIIWLKLNSSVVIELQRDIDEVLKDDFGKEHRFMSHITIARIKRKVEDINKLENYVKNIKLDLKGKITSFSFKKSTLTKEGPIFNVIERYELK